MLSFAQPLFLLALGGLVVPFLIHRISRARPIAWEFPSIQRIRSTPLPRQGKRAISDWLLLALRTLILALFILALAGPIWTPSEDASTAATAEASSGIILMDYSSSMAGWSAIEESRDILRELDRQSNINWNWMLAPNASDEVFQESLGEQSISDLLKHLDQFPPSREAIDPRQALMNALEIFETTGSPRHLHIISDFQESNWSESLPELPSDIQVHLHRVGSLDRNRNLGIQDAIIVPLEDQKLRIIAKTFNFGNDSAASKVELRTKEETYIVDMEFEPQTSVPVVFEIERPQGDTEASIELIPEISDPYGRDDRLVFRASAPDPREVLALTTDPVSGQGSEEIFFLEQALDTESSTDWLRYLMLEVGVFAITPDNLSWATAVFIPSSSFGDPSIPWDTLVDYVNEGGLVVVTMGEDSIRGVQALRRAGVTIGEYLSIAGRSRMDRFFVGPFPENSPLQPVFDGPAQRDLYLMSIGRHARLRLTETSLSLLQTEDGFPLLASIPHGKGNFALSTFPWDRSASDFPLRPSFLPIIREIFALSNKEPNANGNEVLEPPIPYAESVTAYIDPEDILLQLNPRSLEDPVAGETSIASDRALSFAPWLLLAAILAFITESLLARKLIAPA